MLARLYHQGELSCHQHVELSPQNSHHLARVLRARVGAPVQLFNGDGKHYDGKLITVDNKRCTVQIESDSPCHTESPVQITLLQGLSRNDRMDTCLQKSTELGVTDVVPVICNRSKYKLDARRQQKKMQHWQQIIVSACEQSGRCVVPHLHEPVSLATALQSLDADEKLFLDPGAQTSVAQRLCAEKASSYSIAIGPESGFDQQEKEHAVQHGFQAVSFGPRTLRTETAGPAAIAVIQALRGDLQ